MFTDMQYEEYQEHGENYIRIDKTKARQKFNDGKVIYLIQDRMRLPNVWQMPCPIDSTRDSAIGKDFDSHVRDFRYYNCDNERGRGDLECRGFDVSNVSDGMMTKLANKMSDDYLEQLYWESMIIIAEYMGIPYKEGKEDEE